MKTLMTMTIATVLTIGSSQLAWSNNDSERKQELVGAFDYLEVPEVRSIAGSRKIQTAWIHLKGLTGGTPTLVFFGGPGESALDYSSLEALRRAHAKLLAAGDVVFVEQRGVGASRPTLDCKTLQFPLDKPLTRQAVLDGHSDILKSCIKASGADMRGYTAQEIADDADAIRAHLGFDSVNVSGASFGAHQAYTYIRRHGEHVNRAVLSQFLAPNTSLALPTTIDSYLNQIGDRVGPSYGIKTGGGEMMKGLIKGVFERVETTPVDIDLGEAVLTIGRTDLEIITALALRRTRESWMMPVLFTQMNEGEFTFIGQIIFQFFRGGFPINAAVLAFDCVDQSRTDRRAKFASEVESSLSGYGAHLPFPDVCDVIDHGGHDETSPSPEYLSGVPTLFIQGELDARARDENLNAFVAYQDNVRVLVIRNVTHDLGRSVSDTIGEELAGIEARFLENGTWPESDEIEVPLSLN